MTWGPHKTGEAHNDSPANVGNTPVLSLFLVLVGLLSG